MSPKKYVATPTRTKEILSKYKFAFKKSLGQNFIIDVNILENIIKHAGITESSGVIEIGPGIGALTEQLALNAETVIAYEIDDRLLPILQETLQDYKNVHIIYEDILQANIQLAIQKYFSKANDLHIVANLPYYITTPIVMKLLADRLPVTSMTIMIQKEVADRMAAQPNSKSYGSLSIAVQYYTDAQTVMHVPRQVFMPQPNVDSSVLKLTLREHPLVHVIDEEYFFSLVRACFAQRRKTIRNNLVSYFKQSLPREMIATTLENAGIDGQRRGESLHIEEFAQVANAFYNIQHS
ncbi:MAG TPA: 16S rRNA (adenine(1518)-N(6)/adenine(1519)-N(6))-dimethyltransferase RsmA [Virgibacillus sp.]|nr:16S rRNA (adenine(1518)-N(6)/adenine(1519)-N(6))-dimethyltransferase RsmA [Virgibacillus sp.]